MFENSIALRLFFVVSAALAVSGCSRLSILYGLAETAVSREAEFFLDLDDAGQTLVDRKVDALLAWHGKVMLPRYARYLRAQADMLDRRAPDRAAVGSAITELRHILDDLVAGASPFVAGILVEHTDTDKLRYLEARMTERLAERQEEAAEPLEDRLEERVERITENFERLTGDLNDVQMGFVHRYAEKTSGDNAVWLRNRAKRQRAFLDFLARKPDENQISAFIHTILLRAHEIVEPEYQAVSEARWMRFQDLLFEIVNSLTPEQRERSIETLREYAAEMLELSS